MCGERGLACLLDGTVADEDLDGIEIGEERVGHGAVDRECPLGFDHHVTLEYDVPSGQVHRPADVENGAVDEEVTRCGDCRPRPA